VPSVKVAVISEGRHHGPAGVAPKGPSPGPARPTDSSISRPGNLRGAPPARCGPLRRGHHPHRRWHQPGLPRPRYRGNDRLYLPGRPDRFGHPLQRRRVPHAGRKWAEPIGNGARSRARAAASEVAEELVALYRRRAGCRRARVWSRYALAARSSSRLFPHRRPRTSCGPSPRSRPTWKSPARWTGSSAAMSGSARPKWRCAPVFKAVQEGKQAARLGSDNSAREPAPPDFFGALRPRNPIRVELLSRFALGCPRPAPWWRAWRRVGRRGRRAPTACLAQDISFRDLGLLVVDEEQRFGVTHKEAVKRIADGIDVLTLTAKSIPAGPSRWHWTVSGTSLSINTPPADRRPILTYVGEQDEAAVSEAIRRELVREGQAF